MSDALPSFVREPAPRQRLPRQGLAWLALVALGLLLGLQVLLADRARLALDPFWRPHLVRLCAALACKLPPWHEPQRLVVVAREVSPHPEIAGALRLHLSFRNDATWPQAWPVLELAFTDVEGQLQAQRFFNPREYRADLETAREIAVGQTVEAQIDLVDPGNAAIAFNIEFR